MAFPVEVLETIFKYLDGPSFRNASMVNRFWRQEVNRKSLVFNNWERICMDEIPRNVLEEISLHNNLNLPVSFESLHDKGSFGHVAPTLDWYSAYKIWYSWGVMPMWPSTQRSVVKPKLSTKNERITCMKISGEFVVTGHHGGCVMMWNIYPGRVVIGYPHIAPVTDMLCLKIDMGVATEVQGNNAYPVSVPGHDLIATVAEDGKVSMTWLTKYCMSNVGEYVMHRGPVLPEVHTGPIKNICAISSSVFAVNSEDNKFSLWKITGCEPQVELLFHCNSDKLNIHKLSNHGITEDSIEHQRILRCSNASYYYHTLMQNRTGAEEEFPCALSFFRNSTAIYIEIDLKWTMVISVLDFNVPAKFASASYDVLSLMPSEPTSWLLYGQVLILGLQSGSLLMYRVRCDNDLLHLKLSRPIWRLKVSNEPIVKLAVDDGPRPRIAAATVFTICHIMFQRPASNVYRSGELSEEDACASDTESSDEDPSESDNGLLGEDLSEVDNELLGDHPSEVDN